MIVASTLSRSRVRAPLLASHPLMRFTLRRVAIGVVLVWVVSVLVFLGTNLLPGDAARAALGSRATAAQVEQVRHDLGLDRPVLTRYADWMGGLLQGDLGTSLTAGGAIFSTSGSKTPVSKLIGGPVRNTLVLALAALLLVIPLSITLGVLAGIRPGGPLDRVISTVTLAGLAVPDFVIGTVLILLFAVGVALLPPVSLVAPGETPLAHPDILVLPVATLVIATLGFATRQIRAGVARAMESDFVEMARLNGVRERRVVLGWALRNSIAPSIQTITQVAQYLLGGVVLTEYVFGYPGIGAGLVQYVAARYLMTVHSVAVLIAVIYVGLNIVADLLVVLVVPRLRTAQ
ncbi:MAG: oligopeptide/dipeptide transporter, permease protein [Solirubrobacterales bacterium]|nr:oligopeptide/dipeptide transporter, permease protein [Solirubrobacterales bacterium]